MFISIEMIVVLNVDCWIELFLNGMLIVDWNDCWMESWLLHGMTVEWNADCWME